MMKTQIGLGVPSLPNVLITLGIVPGILCLIAMVRRYVTTGRAYELDR